MEAVEYVVRQFNKNTWHVWMVHLDASHTPARFLNSSCVSTHRSMNAADKKAALFRAKDEAHISKVQA